MYNIYTDYRMLLNRFIDGSISPEDFQNEYLSRFKNEKRKLDQPLFELLDSLFGDVDAFTSDKELLAENPGFYLDEVALRKKITQAFKKIIWLQSGKE